MYRTLLALALLLVLAAPAQAQDLVTEDDCRTATGLRSSCVGLAKLGERVSAECRRLGRLDDEQCHSRVGRKVLRSQITDYEQSRTHRVLDFQHHLGDTVALRDAPWVGTHNSYNSTSEEPTLSHTDSNQQLTLTDQLRLDVRSLELDVHWLPTARANGRYAPVLCHGQGNVGCTNERLLRDRLAEVESWLSANPDEVLLLYLEDGIGDPLGYAAAVDVVMRTIGPRVFTPQGTGPCSRLPLDLTRRSVLAAGKQVLIVSGCGNAAWGSIAHDWPTGVNGVRHESRPKGFSSPECGRVDRRTFDSQLVRFYEDSTFLSAFAAPTGASSTDDGLTPETTRAAVRCGVDLLGFDQLLPRDGRLDALVWSWADGEPASGDCTVQSGSRWFARACTERHLPACRDANGAWFVMPEAVSREVAAARCSAAGARLGTPRTGYENGEVADLARVESVWLGWRGGLSGSTATVTARRRAR